MITLITYPGGFGQFSLSPFCVKAAYLLALSGQPWTREDRNDPRMMPYKKLPVLRAADGHLIPDSHNIQLYLEGLGADFQEGLSDVEKAQSHALIRMAEEHIYFQLVLDRWGREDVWPVIRETYFQSIPRLLRKPVTHALRKTILKAMDAQGLGRLTAAERMGRLEQDLEALSAFLWRGPYLMGQRITLADLSMAPMLAAARSTPVETPLSRRVAEDLLLSRYIDRVQAEILPS
ncbi:glutathione S-transferase family protein [Thalassococcus sp. S3]|uniref:glutathione S-transferase family protein n=1 Tax=Thalassococcus sp. S3 TaxID=2017482 RepID=UPI0010241173|nr:glutathione S-transferase family protein [Thalassococcus sp. S3]QBF29732.1 hypothetical protein CFI11_00685 [Thalassococcus sp. S3]